MGFLVREARKIAKNSQVVDPAFQALQIQSMIGAPVGTGIEMTWGEDRVVRFPNVDTLIDFLKKAA